MLMPPPEIVEPRNPQCKKRKANVHLSYPYCFKNIFFIILIPFVIDIIFTPYLVGGIPAQFLYYSSHAYSPFPSFLPSFPSYLALSITTQPSSHHQSPHSPHPTIFPSLLPPSITTQSPSHHHHSPPFYHLHRASSHSTNITQPSPLTIIL